MNAALPAVPSRYRKALISVAIASLSMLSACGDDSSDDNVVPAGASSSNSSTSSASSISSSVGSSAGSSSSNSSVAQRKPNILFIMADDLGYSDIAAFGGEIHTPNLDALVQSGRLLTNHHTGSVCAITRSMLISGTDHHLVGEGTMGAPSDAERKGQPGYEGYLNDRALSVAQLLKDAGYHTYMAGKWHLGNALAGTVTTGLGTASPGQTPDQWGFERSFALLGGAASNHFAHEAAGSKNYTEDGAYVQPGLSGQPGAAGSAEGQFYSTDFYTQRLIKYIDSNKADGKPFFAYAAYTSPHWPLQVPEPWLSKYKGRYDVGYEVIRAERLARQKALGIIPTDFKENPGAPNLLTRSAATTPAVAGSPKYINALNGPAQGYTDYGLGPVNKKWDSLTPDERKAQARYMEIYAGMVENLDYNIGLLIQHLKDIGEYDNTFIMFHSDNGAEGWPIDSGADPLATDTANAQAAAFAKLGTDNGLASAQRLQYGLRWAEVSATPFKLHKGFMGEGGTGVPAIVHLPGQTAQLPAYRNFTHVTDNTATFLALAGVTPPTTPAAPLLDSNGVDKNKGKVVYDGRNVWPVTGASLLPVLRGEATTVAHNAITLGEESYGRAKVYSADGKWKALWTEPPWGPLDGHWQLFDIAADRGETQDISGQNTDVLAQLLVQWKAYMSSVGGIEPVQPRGYY